MPKLCLNMIVKDESHIIRETLESVTKYIDYYVISDTGSSDNTVEIIKEYFDSVGIKGEIYHDEWKDFGHNRSLALKHAQGKSDYIWIIDADDIIIGDFRPYNLTKDSYLIKIGTDFVYWRQNIFKNFKDYVWKYKGRCHEYPCCDKPNITQENLEGDYYLDSRRLGNRNKDPNKLLKDAKIFEEELEKNPNDERSTFYLAQSYFDHGDIEKGVKYYKKRATMGGFYEEVYYSLYRAAVGLQHLNKDWKEVKTAFMNAHNHSKYRAEPIYEIAKHYRLNDDFENGYKYANYGAKIKFPEQSMLFVSADVYKWKMLDEFSLCAYYSKRYMEAYKAYKKLTNLEGIDDSTMDRFKSGLNFTEDRIKELDKKNCLVHFGNCVISKDNKIWTHIDDLAIFYDVYVTGNRIDFSDSDNYTYLDLDSVKLKKYFIAIFVDSVNFIYSDINANKNVLFLTSPNISYKFTNQLTVNIYNSKEISKLLNKINRIICDSESTRDQLVNKYNILKDYIKILNQDLDDYDFTIHTGKPIIKINNIFHDKEKANGGFEFIYPPSIKKYLDNDMEDDALNETTTKFFNELPKNGLIQSQILLELSRWAFRLKDYDLCETYCRKAIKKIKYKNSGLADDILLQIAKCSYELKKYNESFKLADNILKKKGAMPNIDEIQTIRDKNIEHIKDDLLAYPEDHIKEITKDVKKRDKINVIFSITTCKRYDLFEKTINSFINCCLDANLIDYWLCVDDNSLKKDRMKMEKNYPFFNFVWKDDSQRGHEVSMNIIHDKLSNADYLIHLEDDFHFIDKRRYVTESINILRHDDKLGQVAFNKHYTEVEPYKIKIVGGTTKFLEDGTRYLVHKYIPSGTPEYEREMGKLKSGEYSNLYWPHFTFRPSMHRCKTWREIGLFYKTNHFELEYAKEYIKRGYQTAFLDAFTCIHIGKKTWEKNSENSYALNDTTQFSIKGTKSKFETYVISWNDKIGLDKWTEFKKNARDILDAYVRQPPVSNLPSLNDIKDKVNIDNTIFRRDIISYLFTHRELWNKNKDWILILDDHMIFISNIINQLNKLIKNSNSDDLLGFILGDRSYLVNMEGCKELLDRKFEGLDILSVLNDFKDVRNMNLVTEDNLSFIKKEPKQIEGYTFYSGLDSLFGDLKYEGDIGIEKLKIECDKDMECVAFNTLGYIKTSVNRPEEFILIPNYTGINDGLYVKNNNVYLQNKINYVIKNSIKKEKSNLTFVIIACDGYVNLEKTINNFIKRCKDIGIIDKWICAYINDNLTDDDIDKMKLKYPFFEYITKNKTINGYSENVNFILDKVDTDYIVYFEDSWLCKTDFKLTKYVDLLDIGIFDQLLLISIGGEHKKMDDITIDDIYNYEYNENHKLKNSKYREFDKNNGKIQGSYDSANGWWWPGFSLIPSVINLTKFKNSVGKFNEEIDEKLFEYDYSVRSYEAGMKIAYVNNKIKNI